MKQFIILISGLLILLKSFSVQSQSKKPNIIFILTDDQSYGYMGCEGNEIVKTPNLDHLAAQGIHFTNAHVTSAICTPSRISIFLSQFERKHSVNFNSGTSVSPDAWAKSYPVMMRENGYYMGYIGKNHSPVGDGGYESSLFEKSFDYYYAGNEHLTFYPKQRHPIFEHAKSDTQVEILEEGSLDFLSPQQNLEGAKHFLDQKPRDKPFCLSICFNLPHGAGTGSMKQKPTDDEIYKTLYRDQKIPLSELYVAKKDIRQPKLPANLLKAEDRQTGYDYVDTPEGATERYIREFQTMTGIDRMLGNILTKLKELDLDKNTVIIFTSDHGLFMGEFGLGGKALCYEKVTHVPMIIFDPRMPKNIRGTKSNALVQTIDIAPTMLSLGGIQSPDEFQGKDLSSFLIEKNPSPVRDYLFTENLWSTHFGNPRCEAIQDKEWKYIRYYKNENFSALKKIGTAKMFGIPEVQMLYGVHDSDIAVYRDYIESPLNGEQPVYEELYDLKNDPLETKNLINNKSHQQEYERLKEAWQKAIKKAHGEGNPKVLRYTVESKLDYQK